MARTAESLKLELKKWKAKEKETKPRYYALYLVFVFCLAYVIDEIAGNINTTLQNEVISTYFPGDKGLSVYTVIITLCTAVSVLSFLYKPLADRYGRKPFLVINTLGMGIGMFICFIAGGILPLYILGIITVYFFTPCDVHIVYVLECVSDKHRNLWVALYKSVGLLSISLVSVFKGIAESINYWQFTFFIPALIGVAIGIIYLFFTKETDVFIKNRIKVLKVQIREAEHPEQSNKKKLKNRESDSGLIAGIRYMLDHKRLLWLFLIGVFFSIATIGTSNYSAIIDQNVISKESMNQILLVFPFLCAATQLTVGLISDKFGRKSSIGFSGFFTFFGLLCFIVGLKANWGSHLCGAMLGLFIGGYYSSVDVFNVMCAEQSPTNIRTSIMSILSISTSVGSFIATGILLIVNQVVSEVDLGFFGLILAIPALFIGLMILANKIPETNKVSLENYDLDDKDKFESPLKKIKSKFSKTKEK